MKLPAGHLLTNKIRATKAVSLCRSLTSVSPCGTGSFIKDFNTNPQYLSVPETHRSKLFYFIEASWQETPPDSPTWGKTKHLQRLSLLLQHDPVTSFCALTLVQCVRWYSEIKCAKQGFSIPHLGQTEAAQLWYTKSIMEINEKLCWITSSITTGALASPLILLMRIQTLYSCTKAHWIHLKILQIEFSSLI